MLAPCNCLDERGKKIGVLNERANRLITNRLRLEFAANSKTIAIDATGPAGDLRETRKSPERAEFLRGDASSSRSGGSGRSLAAARVCRDVQTGKVSPQEIEKGIGRGGSLSN